MQLDNVRNNSRDELSGNIGEVTSAGPINTPRSAVVVLISTVGTATLISLFVGLCYYYTHHYREAYLGRLSLDPEILPITMQEAIAEGFEGVVMNVLWIATILTLGILTYIALTWYVAYTLQKLVRKLGISLRKRAPHPALAELGRNEGFRVSLVASLIAIGATLMGGLAVFLVGIPADAAGTRAASALLEKVRSASARCVRYEMKDGGEVVGWPIGSTGDRQFVLGNDSAAYVIKFDDLQRINEASVPCQTFTAASHLKFREPDRLK